MLIVFRSQDLQLGTPVSAIYKKMREFDWKSVFNCTISNNKFINNFFAIYLAKSANCTISNNYIEGEKKRETNSGNGIHLWYCKDISVENNTILNHRDGIYFEFVRNGKITNNFSKENLRYGLHFMFSDSCEYRRKHL